MRELTATVMQVGGGYQQHDLSDLTLTWMAVRADPPLQRGVLTLSAGERRGYSRPELRVPDDPTSASQAMGTIASTQVRAPCTLYPSLPTVAISPLTGVCKFAKTIQRTLPTVTNDITHETVHPSVLEQPHNPPQLAENTRRNPGLICSLHPIEEELRRRWVVHPQNEAAQANAGMYLSETVTEVHQHGSVERVVSEAKRWVDAVDNSTAAVLGHLLR